MRRLAILAVLLLSRSAIADDMDAPDPDEERTASKAFELDTTYFSLRLGGGVLIDYATYAQDLASKEQMFLNPESGIRDLRGLASGRLIFEQLRYTVGLAFIQSSNEWRFRQTGFIVRIPELEGFLFIGRTKEGASTNKFMVGYYGWFNERSAANDAFYPILADGARWLGVGLGGKLVYNVGAFADPVSEKESFNKNDWALVGRAVWLPFTPVEGHVLHLAASFRYAGADDGFLTYRSKPESFLAQSQAVDTGAFPASRSTTVGVEAYYVRGPFAFGSEYYFNKNVSEPTNNPFFHGGEAFVSYLFTGETHPYKNDGGFFDDVVPNKSVFDEGPGAIELAVRGTYVDLDSRGVQGGKFFRATAILNWYMTEALRLEGVVGYGRLDRFGLEGNTYFLQTRIQIQFK
ncbi:MAG: porin [Deltaproteobacteria bacterium]|nr:porin [Deltaproteobacteria bacterium]